MKKPLIAAVLIIVVAASVVAVRATRPTPVRDRLSVSGNIEITDVAIAFRVPGRVVERRVSEGEPLRTGQVVAVLDDTDFVHEMALRRAASRGAVARLSELTAGYRAEEIGQARAALARARAESDRAEVEFERQKDLLAREVISRREFESAEAAHRVARAQVEEARQKLALLDQGPRPEQIEQARQQVAESEEALAIAETRWSYATLSAPVGGVVLAEHVEAGEYVAAGAPVVTVGDLRTVWLRGYIDETDLGRVKLGQHVRVRTDTYPGETYNGTVTFISSEAEFTPKSVQTARERVKLVYRIKVEIDNPLGELKAGMPADAEILLATE